MTVAHPSEGLGSPTAPNGSCGLRWPSHDLSKWLAGPAGCGARRVPLGWFPSDGLPLCSLVGRLSMRFPAFLPLPGHLAVVDHQPVNSAVGQDDPHASVTR